MPGRHATWFQRDTGAAAGWVRQTPAPSSMSGDSVPVPAPTEPRARTIIECETGWSERQGLRRHAASIDGASPGEVERGAGREGAFFRRQPGDHGGDLGREAESTHRD